MNIIIIRLIIISLILLLTIFWIIKYIRDNKSPPISYNKPTIKQTVKDVIKQGGTFFKSKINKDIANKPQNLYYIVDKKVYLVGTCEDCPDACSSATEIKDVIKYIRCDSQQDICPNVPISDRPNTYKRILLSTAEDVEKQLLDVAIKDRLSIKDCVSLIPNDTNSNNDDYVEYETSESIISNFFKSGYKNIWDWIKDNPEQVTNAILLFGPRFLPKVMAGYASSVVAVYFLSQAFESGDYIGAGVMSSFIVGPYLGKLLKSGVINGILGDSLKQAEKEIAEKGISDIILEKTGEETAELSMRVAAEISARASASLAARAAIASVEIAAGAVSVVFDVIDFLMIVGLILDMWDPCGYEKYTISNEDLDNLKQGFDTALFNTLLNNFKYSPVEWFAEYIAEYKLDCDIMDNATKSEKIDFKMTDEDKKICDEDAKKLTEYTQEYLNNLKVNVFGQCIEPVKDIDIIQHMQKVLPPGTITDEMIEEILDPTQRQKDIDLLLDPKTYTNNIFDYTILQIAGENVIVAKFFKKYVAIVIGVLSIILGITFFV